MSAGLRSRLELAQRRATWRQAETLGVAPEDLRVMLLRAYVVWRTRLPWRLLPDALVAWAFERFGRRSAARYIERSGDGAT